MHYEWNKRERKAFAISDELLRTDSVKALIYLDASNGIVFKMNIFHFR